MHSGFADLQQYGDCVHTLVERKRYSGVFLPHFQAVTDNDPLENITYVISRGRAGGEEGKRERDDEKRERDDAVAWQCNCCG